MGNEKQNDNFNRDYDLATESTDHESPMSELISKESLEDKLKY